VDGGGKPPTSQEVQEVCLLYDVKQNHAASKFADVLGSSSSGNCLFTASGTSCSNAVSSALAGFSLTEAPSALLSSMEIYLKTLGSSPGALVFSFFGAAAAAQHECAATIDSGADVHVLSYDDAMKLFQEIQASQLKVVGVNGASTTADVQGQLIITVEGNSGTLHRFDLGTAHGMHGCPMNLLSLSLLFDVGSVIHFEKGDCWIQPPSAKGTAGETERIPLQRVGGLFQLPISKFIYSSFSRGENAANESASLNSGMLPGKCGLLSANESESLNSGMLSGKFGLLSANESERLTSGMSRGSNNSYDNYLSHSCSIKGHSFLSGDLELWHRRMRHVSKTKLKQIWSQNIVDGFHLVGNKNENRNCEVLRSNKNSSSTFGARGSVSESPNVYWGACFERCEILKLHKL